MTAYVFGGGINDDCRAVIEGSREQGRGRVVNDQRDAVFAPDACHLGDRENRELRIGKRFGIIGARAIVSRPPKILGIGRIDEADLDANIPECVGEKIPCAAVKIGRADDIVPRPRQILDRQRRRGLT